MTIDDATEADLPALHRLIERAYRGDSAKQGWTHEADLLGGQRTDLEALGAMLADPAQAVLLLRGERGPLSCIALADKGEGVAYIGMVTVDPERQAAGIGRTLLKAAEDLATSRFGAVRAEMTVIAQREELIAWYERRGYERSGERRPFPATDPRFGIAKRDDLEFIVLEKRL